MATTNEEIPPQEDTPATKESHATDVEAVGDAYASPASGEPGPFALAVDPNQKYKAKELKICSFARPHMRAFHVSKCCN